METVEDSMVSNCSIAEVYRGIVSVADVTNHVQAWWSVFVIVFTEDRQSGAPNILER
jgi:hypothetical protein